MMYSIMHDLSKRTLIKDTLQKIGEEVVLFGWVQTVRKHGKIAFFDLKDRSGVIQVAGLDPSVVTHIAALNPQDVITIFGVVKKREERYINPSLPTGTVEVEAKNISVLSKAREMPFDMGGKDLVLELPTLLDYRSLTLRHAVIAPIFRVQAALAEGFRTVAKSLNCTEIFVPTITASATEGGADVFQVNYYGRDAFMSQSPQLYKQMLVPVFERVYTIAHAYRAEPSVTTRHLSESTQMDCEFGFVNFSMLLDLVEQVGTETLRFAEKHCIDELSLFAVPKIMFGTIPRLTLSEAQDILFKETGNDVRRENDLSPSDEIVLWEWAKKTHHSDFVTVTHFPTKKRAFYTMPDPNNSEFSLSYDLLFRGLEILSGSQRINEYDQLAQAIKDRGLNPKQFGMYLQAFQYGMPQEGGFSFGLERMTMKLLELPNIREASLYPRDMERVDERFSLTGSKV